MRNVAVKLPRPGHASSLGLHVASRRPGLRLASSGGPPPTKVTDEQIGQCAQKLLPMFQSCVRDGSTTGCIWQMTGFFSALDQCRPVLSDSIESGERVLEMLAKSAPQKK